MKAEIRCLHANCSFNFNGILPDDKNPALITNKSIVRSLWRHHKRTQVVVGPNLLVTESGHENYGIFKDSQKIGRISDVHYGIPPLFRSKED